MIDTDFFKDFNDNYGHVAGDECLKKIAATLAASTHRVGDLVARYGGEEFGVVLPETNQTGAVSIAETIQANVTALNMTHAFSGCSDRVTVSIGTCTTVPTSDSDPVVLLEVADKMLYEAKQDGRNRVRSYVA